MPRPVWGCEQQAQRQADTSEGPSFPDNGQGVSGSPPARLVLGMGDAQGASTSYDRTEGPEMMSPSDIRATADALSARLAAVERGEQSATPVQHAYLSGAEQALRGVLGEGQTPR